LEERVKESDALKESYRAIQAENYQLRDYIINLQSRLLESQGEYPQPPSNIELSNPRTVGESDSSTHNLQAQAAQAQVQAEAAEAERRHQGPPLATPGSNSVSQVHNASRDEPMRDAPDSRHSHYEPARYAPVTTSDFTPANPRQSKSEPSPSVDKLSHMRATAEQALRREMAS
jgi:hypothetical protein